MLYYVWDCLKFVQKLFQYNSQNLFRFVTVVLGMTDIIKRVWILSAFLWNPPGYTCVVFVVFLIWLEWAEALDFPCQLFWKDNVFKMKGCWSLKKWSEDFSCVTIKFTWSPTRLCNILMIPLHPLTPMSDQNRISPYRINTISSRQVVRKRNISIWG